MPQPAQPSTPPPTIPPVRPDWRILTAAVLFGALAGTQAGFAPAAAVFMLVMVSAALWRGLALLGYIASALHLIVTDDEDDEDEVRFHG